MGRPETDKEGKNCPPARAGSRVRPFAHLWEFMWQAIEVMVIKPLPQILQT